MSTIDLDEATIAKYIRGQEQHDIMAVWCTPPTGGGAVRSFYS